MRRVAEPEDAPPVAEKDPGTLCAGPSRCPAPRFLGFFSPPLFMSSFISLRLEGGKASSHTLSLFFFFFFTFFGLEIIRRPMSYSQCPRIILIEFSCFLREDGWRDTIQFSKSLIKAFDRKSPREGLQETTV